jgi:hypothetical protein
VSDFQKVILVLNALVLKLYNHEVASVKEIKSYDDNNFHVTVMFNQVCLSLYRSYEIFFHLGKKMTVSCLIFMMPMHAFMAMSWKC